MSGNPFPRDSHFGKQVEAALAKPAPKRPRKLVAAIIGDWPEPLAGPDEIVFTLPLPPRELQPNQKIKLNHFKRAKLMKAARAIAATFASMVLFRGWKATRLDVEIWTARRMDDDGITGWLKSTRDGIADGLGVDDATMKWGAIVQHNDGSRKGKRQLRITITRQ